MYCNNCGNTIADGMTFCTMCGTKMEKTEENKATNQTCCICGSNLNDKSETLLIGKEGIPKNMCANCALHIEALENNTNKMKINEALAHFDHYKNYMDREAKDCISNILKEKQLTNNSENGSANSTTSSWVVILRAVAWIIFWGIIIAGLVMGILARDMGFVIFLISIPVAFLSVSWTMIFLDLADDIRKIKILMLDKK